MSILKEQEKTLEGLLTFKSVINKGSSPFQSIKCINTESKIYSVNKTRSVCHLAPRLVRDMRHLICVLTSRVCKFKFLGIKTFFLFQLCWYSYIYKLDDLPSVAFHLKGHLTSALIIKTFNFKNPVVQYSCVFIPIHFSLVLLFKYLNNERKEQITDKKAYRLLKLWFIYWFILPTLSVCRRRSSGREGEALLFWTLGR